MSEKEADLQMILHREPDNQFKLYACRGAGRGCERNKFRNAKKPCDDCVKCDDESETLGQLQERLKKGDA